MRLLILFFTILIFTGCSIFEDDGLKNSAIDSKNGYLYILERSSNSLIMLDSKLYEIKRWDLTPLTPDSSAQGLTFDGRYIWFSSAGNTDMIYQLDTNDDSLIIVKSFPAPPNKRGTIRDISWDGFYLWAINSGSTTYNIPPTLYKLNPKDGSIISEYIIPSPEPRALEYVSQNGDIYGRGAEVGLYFTDVNKKSLYKFRIDRPQFDTAFASPIPPRGIYNIYPVGLSFDGTYFWLINSSGDADHLYKLNYRGLELDRYDLPYQQPGPLVWTNVDIRAKFPPVVIAVFPNSGARGSTINIEIYGAEFRKGNGLSVSLESGITINSVTFVSSSLIKSNISIDSNATLGKRNVIVTNPDGKSGIGDSLFLVSDVQMNPHLWLIEQDMDTLYKIRIQDTMIVARWDTRIVAPGGSPQGLAYDGQNFWLCASGTDRKIIKLNLAEDHISALTSFPSPTTQGTLRGITWEDGFIWLVVSGLSPSKGKIYKINANDGTAVDSLLTPGLEPRGITIANGLLYCNDTTIDSVFVYDKVNSTWNSVFATPTPPGGTTANRFATGMTWDGTNFWIANSTGNFDHVFKVSPTGSVLFYFESPRIGPAMITGIVYTKN